MILRVSAVGTNKGNDNKLANANENTTTMKQAAANKQKHAAKNNKSLKPLILRLPAINSVG